ncbi:MAG TPA: hypothetical protein VMW14_01765, partial [Candidatus Paceibacterota bacterium]|nr:hypothetical protein [Candidatus Paceibacterota bacterium]
GEFSIKATCSSVVSSLQTYNFSYPVASLTVRTNFEGRIDTVIVPVKSNLSGAFVKIETLVCNVKLERIQGGG